ncbi:protein-glutamate O-methyltransferase [Aliidongia dinghuensis]|uniref:Protein-glutamate O-methyltransferase n=1 Tax=Aliidongia dinghuensis TaxID=1867774 RepID=A0A8J3E1K5_9PROT|nr:protein-glutamate O-methyltransferase CheR [Aliidongia dinghuensis]GGF12854.1 protein-glutamate O-methyltransferase [Aliidongia dinghuensis]
MDSSLSDGLLARFSDYLAAQVGLHFAPDRWTELTRGLDRAAADLGFADAAACVLHLLSTGLTRAQIEVLASHLTVGETYFFREPRSFEVLATRVLPDLIQARRADGRALRIWSAACCTGEEPYSIAMLLDRLIPDLADWNITLLATDINPQFLRRAEEGVYKDWSFRGVGQDIRDRYFTREPDGGSRIVPRIKAMVTFSYHNLVEDRFPSIDSNTNAMDVVLCRNVLMYFSPDRARAVVGYLHRALRDGGWLVPSAVDGSPALFAPFVLADVEGTTLYRKQAAVVPQPRPPVRPIVPAPAPMAPRPEPIRSVEGQPDPCRAASALHDQGRYAEASEILVKYLASRPADVSAMLLLARTYANQGRLADALHWSTKLVAADRLNAGHHYLLAMIQQEMGALADAAASLHRALFLDPGFVLAHFASANLARIEGKRPEARKHYRNTLELLRGRAPGDVLPESEGLTVDRLREIVRHAAEMVEGGKP